jgi:hypothetical protein
METMSETPGRTSLRGLREILADRFEASELQDVCFDLGVDYESLAGEGKADKVRALIIYHEHRDMIPELVQEVLYLRPTLAPRLEQIGLVPIQEGPIQSTVSAPQPSDGLAPMGPPGSGDQRPIAAEWKEADRDVSTEGAVEHPPDLYFMNHTSFLRPDKQQEFQARTGVNADHYDIRVILDSFYPDALERVEHVTYYLHKAYGQYGSPIRIRANPGDKFLLKELANGEYVLVAEVKVRGEQAPIILNRYITLWKCGPRIERYL